MGSMPTPPPGRSLLSLERTCPRQPCSVTTVRRGPVLPPPVHRLCPCTRHRLANDPRPRSARLDRALDNGQALASARRQCLRTETCCVMPSAQDNSCIPGAESLPTRRRIRRYGTYSVCGLDTGPALSGLEPVGPLQSRCPMKILTSLQAAVQSPIPHWHRWSAG